MTHEYNRYIFRKKGEKKTKKIKNSLKEVCCKEGYRNRLVAEGQ
jgi:hypothetical protein